MECSEHNTVVIFPWKLWAYPISYCFRGKQLFWSKTRTFPTPLFNTLFSVLLLQLCKDVYALKIRMVALLEAEKFDDVYIVRPFRRNTSIG